MACSHATACPLFAQFQLDSTLRSWKIMYCDSDTRSRNCHRFKLSERGHTVPLNLLPNGTMLDIDAGASAALCGPARVPDTSKRPARERVAAAAAAVAVAERIAPARPTAATMEPAVAHTPGSSSVAANKPSTPAPPTEVRIAPVAAAPAPAPRARSILDRLLGRKA